jgi:hypothetical protein
VVFPDVEVDQNRIFPAIFQVMHGVDISWI